MAQKSSRYSLALVKRDGSLYKRKPAEKYWKYARFGLIDKRGNVKRIIDGVPFNLKNLDYLQSILDENPTLKTFEPALKQEKSKKRTLNKKVPKNELVIVSRNGRVYKELPPSGTEVYYGIRTKDQVNLINVPMKYRGFLLKDNARQKQRLQKFYKSQFEILQKLFQVNYKNEVVFYLDNLGRIRPPTLRKENYQRVFDVEKQKFVLKRGQGLCGAVFNTKGEFKIWIGSNFMELEANDFIDLKNRMSVVPKNGKYSEEIELKGTTVREAVRNVILDYTEKQWEKLQENTLVEFDYIGYFKEDGRNIGFSGGGSLKGNLFNFQKDLAKQIVESLAQTGHRFTQLSTLKNIEATNRSFLVDSFNASDEAKAKLKIRSTPKNVRREKLLGVKDQVFIKLRIITQR